MKKVKKMIVLGMVVLSLMSALTFSVFSAGNVIRSHNGIPCEYGRLRRVEESQKG